MNKRFPFVLTNHTAFDRVASIICEHWPAIQKH